MESIIDRLLEKNDRSAAPFPYPTQPQPPTSSSSSSRKEVGGVIHSDSDRLEKIERQLNALTESVQRSVSISPKRTIAGVRLQSPDFKSEDEPSSPPPKPRFQVLRNL